MILLNYLNPYPQKSGSSSKPIQYESDNKLYSKFCSVFRNISVSFLRRIGLTLIVILCSFSFYLYLDQRYLVDEIHQGDRLREPYIEEQFTLRIISPKTTNALTDFILKYSLCLCVHEIQIIYLNPSIPPELSTFKFAHTHSKIKFLNAKSFFTTTISTESVLLMDADVSISCEDLTFTQSVWRSSRDAVVGYFPRMHSISSKDKSAKFHNYFHVVWNSAYSILLSGGIMMKKEYLKVLYESPENVLNFMKHHPICQRLAISIIISSWQQKNLQFVSKYSNSSTVSGEKSQYSIGPIWIDTGLRLQRVSLITTKDALITTKDALITTKDALRHENLQSSNELTPLPTNASSHFLMNNDLQLIKRHLSVLRLFIPDDAMIPNMSMGHCLNHLMDLLQMDKEKLSYSYHKASMAKKDWVW